MYIGIDLGGTKISALAIAEDGRALARRRLVTPIGYSETLAALAAVSELYFARSSFSVAMSLFWV